MSNKSKKSKKSRKNEDKYGKLSRREKLLRRPDTEIGSMTLKESEDGEWIVNPKNIFKSTSKFKFRSEITDYTMVKKKIMISDGITRMLTEILSNGTDNVKRTVKDGEDPGKIYVTIDETTVTVRNEGLPIPVKKKKFVVGDERDRDHEIIKTYIPDLIFGHFDAGSNFDDDEFENNSNIGKNGMGAKIVNAFSDNFRIEIFDDIRQKHYIQEWSENMLERPKPEIEDYYNEGSSVTVTYLLDFERFGIDCYTTDIIAHYVRMCVDASFTCKIPIFFNGNEIDFSDYKDYYKLYFPDVKNVLYYKRKKDEVIVLDTSYNGNLISFSNCQYNPAGGTHQNEAKKVFGNYIRDFVNKEIKDDKSIKIRGITITDVVNHISIITSVHVKAPGFDSQTKIHLTSPNVKFTPDEKLLAKMNKWDIVESLRDVLDFKLRKKLTNAAKTTSFKIKYKDAKNVGKKGKFTILGIAEGNSAYNKILAYANTLSDEEKANIGAFALKGKPMNAMKKSILKLLENKVILSLQKVLRLDPELDYSIKKNFDTLRYKQIILFADADVDGYHIRGLILAFFNKYYRKLLKLGYVTDFRTPYLKLYKGAQTLSFIYERQYLEWLEENSTKGWVSFYIKGLGSIKEDEIEEDLGNSILVYLVYDKKARKKMKLAFGNGMEDERKIWILTPDNELNIDEASEENNEYISTFIDKNMKDYSKHNIHRCIPNAIDGLKPVQRKILYFMLYKTFGFNTYTNNYMDSKSGNVKSRKAALYSTSKRPQKVATLSALVKAKVGYHHGEKSMEEAIFKMGNEFIGSNNLPYLRGIADFGDRSEYGANHAASRYPDATIQWWLKYCYSEKDTDNLRILDKEGQLIEDVTKANKEDLAEPEILYPIVPMILINGCKAIATGWSTSIPNYDPFDIIDWLLCRIEGYEDTPKLVPWYSRFKGEIVSRKKRKIQNKEDNSKKSKKKRKKDNLKDDKYDTLKERNEESQEDFEEENKVEELECDVEDNKTSAKRYVEIFGDFRLNDNIITVTELPIGISTLKYTEYLEKLKEEKKIKDYYDDSYKDKIHIEIYDYKGIEDRIPDCKDIKLRKTFGLTNMTLISPEGIPKIYKDVYEIIEEFYNFRKRIYRLRKLSMVKNLENEIEKINQKVRFVKAVINKVIILQRDDSKEVNTEELEAQMEEMKIDKEYLTKIPVGTLTSRYRDKLLKKYQELLDKLYIVKDTPSKEMWLDDLNLFKEMLEANYELMFLDTKKKKR